MQNQTQISAPTDDLLLRASDVKKASIELPQSSNEERQEALSAMADSLHNNAEKIIPANEKDLQRSKDSGLSQSLLSRLKLNKDKLSNAIKGVRQVACLSDPIGLRQLHRELDKGLVLERVTVPLGVLGVIFESRPDAVMQIASLAIRSGNGAILKGGSEACLTNEAIVKALHEGLNNSNVPANSLCLLTTREESDSGSQHWRVDGSRTVDHAVPLLRLPWPN